jgi:hypothetical protein
MDLMLEGEFGKKLVVLLKKDPNLAHALAEQWAVRVDQAALHRYLLDEGVAIGLLTTRLQKAPEETLEGLKALSQGRAVAKPGRRPAGRPKKKVAAGAPKKEKKRLRFSQEAVEEIKSQIRTFLGRNTWASRKQIQEIAKIPTQALYRRIMSDLRDANEVIQRGQKSKTLYALTGTKAGAEKAAGKPRKRAAARGRPRKAGGRRAK